MYRIVQSICGTSETNVTLHANYTLIKKIKKEYIVNEDGDGLG